MTLLSTGPYFMWMVIFIVLSHLLSIQIARSPLWNFRSSGLGQSVETKGFNLPLESLRGILALSVLFHHGCITYLYYKTGTWSPPPSYFYSAIGPVAVTLFFMVSGYLFWAKALAKGEIKGLAKFFSSRFRRILPAYFTLVLVVVFFVAILSKFELQVPRLELFRELLSWGTVGIIRHFPDINRVKSTLVICAGVVWTLRLEMIFYLLMPILARFSRVSGTWGIILLFLVGHQILIHSFRGHLATEVADFSHYFITGFGFGFIVADFEFRWPHFARRCAKSKAMGLLASVALVITFTLQTDKYTISQSMILSVFFAAIAFKNDLFGLLSTRGLELLGKVSYAIYLFHGVMLYTLAAVINKFYSSFSDIGGVAFWLYVGASGLCTIFLSVIIYRYIEMPFLLGKRCDLSGITAAA